MSTTLPWEQRVADKRQRQHDSIPKEWLIEIPAEDVLDVTHIPTSCGLLSEKDVEITETTDLNLLLEKLASGIWTSVEVTTAFCKRAVIAHQLTNCLTEIFIDRALKRAAELDEHFRTTGKTVGPLHGLPVSLKDQLAIEGLETTMGYVAWIGQYAERNAVLVDILLEAGAVPFVRTNVPQTLMWAETYNKIFGRTVNPYNRLLTSGGSSGGEGALLALKGSPLGVGSDIGGSIRIPSAFCGLYGLRTSYHRVPYGGAMNSMQGSEGIPSVLGPLTNSLNGVKTFMKSVIASRPWTKDPYTIRKAWDEEAYRLSEHGGPGAKLCFGIMWHNGALLPHPPVTRGLKITKDALIASGHTVIDWEPLMIQEIQDMVGALWEAGSYEDYNNVVSLSGEPLIADMAPDKEHEVQEPKEGASAYALWQLHKKKLAIREAYLKAWNATVEKTKTGRSIDALLVPNGACVAVPHGENRHGVYASPWNAVDYPGLVIPITKLDPKLDAKFDRDSYFGDDDKESWEWYKPELSLNAPITVTIVAQTLEEEALIGMGEIVDAAIKAFMSNSKTQ